MIPLRDKNRSLTTPVVNYALIGACAVVFLWQFLTGDGGEALIMQFAVVPQAVSLGLGGQAPFVPAFLPLLTSMFLHGGWMHLIGNMIYLYIFGDNVEDRLGHVRYLFFYLLCGVASAAAQVLSDPASEIPLVGASGAIAGVLGAYLFLYPRARILTLIPLMFAFPIIEVPAYLFLGFWIVLQVIQAYLSSGMEVSGGGVAWWAHAGGFAAGAALLPLFLLGRGRGAKGVETWEEA
jgi:membrane associated rhomboid family serine protease